MKGVQITAPGVTIEADEKGASIKAPGVDIKATKE
jgi:hypothetical protein